MRSQNEKAEAFRALHADEPFVIPNPWDAGSARVLEALGFKALATTSSGFAFTLGRRDGGVSLDEVAGHTATLVRATDLPLSVDLENGYGAIPHTRRPRSSWPRRTVPSAARSRTSTPPGISTIEHTPPNGSPPPRGRRGASVSRLR
jgi:Phosphoenolpyruvate phosphomutase